MNSQTVIRKESYEITKSSRNGFKLEKSLSTKTDGNLIYVSVDFQPIKRSNLSSLSSYIERLKLADQSLSEELAQARKEISEVLYPEQKSLKVLRLQRGWSQNDLANKIKTSQPQIAKIESGKVDVQISTIRKLAKAFHMSVGDMAELIANEGV